MRDRDKENGVVNAQCQLGATAESKNGLGGALKPEKQAPRGLGARVAEDALLYGRTPPASVSTAQVRSGAECFDLAGHGTDFSVEFKDGATRSSSGPGPGTLSRLPCGDK